ncbi:glycosyltransferase family 2 protein [Thermophilibacter sp.]
MRPDITVIITTYNQPFEVVARSLRSVLLQEEVSPEVVIADDHSEVDLSERYRDFFERAGFEAYRIVRHDENIKTVLNLADGLSSAAAPYVKPIDAGDLLASGHSLRDILSFCRSNEVRAGFGDIRRFVRDPHGGWSQMPYHAPRELSLFEDQSPEGRRALLLHEMETDDWIPAPAQFYRTEYYQELLYRLSDSYGVQYCQDFTSVLALVDGPVVHLPQTIYWYEWGTGISTNGRHSSRKRLYDDHLRFFRGLAQERPLCASLSKAYARFRAKRLVALYTPLYLALVRLAGTGSDVSEPLEDPFFLNCVSDIVISSS